MRKESVKWKERRATNQNLKGKRSLNEEDLERLWFPPGGVCQHRPAGDDQVGHGLGVEYQCVCSSGGELR